MATFYQVSLSDIRNVSLSELESSKLQGLENGYDSFDSQVNNCSDANAIALTGSKPYDITNGRHRIYLARKKGWSTVRARFV